MTTSSGRGFLAVIKKNFPAAKGGYIINYSEIEWLNQDRFLAWNKGKLCALDIRIGDVCRPRNWTGTGRFTQGYSFN
jgi:hypothetical protein